MLRYAHSHECPIEERTKVIEGASEILNAHYKSWADSQPDPFAYDVVKKESVGYMDRLTLHLSLREKTIKKMRNRFSSKKYRVV